jgi:hypothetical protein
MTPPAGNRQRAELIAQPPMLHLEGDRGGQVLAEGQSSILERQVPSPHMASSKLPLRQGQTGLHPAAPPTAPSPLAHRVRGFFF